MSFGRDKDSGFYRDKDKAIVFHYDATEFFTDYLPIGQLVTTNAGLFPDFRTDEQKGVQCWPGFIEAKTWTEVPEMLYICSVLPENLIGQVVETQVVSLDSMRFLMVKILTAVSDSPGYFWVFANELIRTG